MPRGEGAAGGGGESRPVSMASPINQAFQVTECENGGWILVVPGKRDTLRMWHFPDALALGVHIGGIMENIMKDSRE